MEENRFWSLQNITITCFAALEKVIIIKIWILTSNRKLEKWQAISPILIQTFLYPCKKIKQTLMPSGRETHKKERFGKTLSWSFRATSLKQDCATFIFIDPLRMFCKQLLLKRAVRKQPPMCILNSRNSKIYGKSLEKHFSRSPLGSVLNESQLPYS